jgi:uncharacterized membrane protein YccF (DUF307 family)
MLRLLGNIIWFLLGGVFMGLAWWLWGLIAIITIIGIPWAKACFVFGKFCFWPFGREAIDRKDLTGKDDIGTGALGLVGNIIWILFGGIWLAIGHLMSAIFCALIIIGIPFAIQHLKLAFFALFPIGKTVVTKEEAEAARLSVAMETVKNMRK